MPNIVLGKSGVAEYVVETTFGAMPTNPAMQWIGLIQSLKATIKTEHEEYRTLKAAAATNKLQIEGDVLLGQSLDIDMDYVMQDWTFFKYVMSLTGGLTMTDDLANIALGLISPDATPKYAQLLGTKIDSAAVEIPERGKAKCTMKLKGANVPVTTNNPWSVTNYKGTGSNATKASTPPIPWSGITAITYGGVVIPSSEVGGVKISIENKLEAVLDAYNTLSTKIGAIEPTERTIKVSLTLKKKTIDAIVALSNAFAAANLVITFASPATTLTFAGARIPQDVIDFAPTGLTSLDVEFSGITGLVFS